MPPLKKPKKVSKSKAKARADAAFSIFIRTRDLDSQGNATCFTCGAKKPWKEMQCGHFYSRAKLGTRFDEINCQVQDAACNIFKSGNIPAFALNLQRKFGPKILEELDRKSKQVVKATVQFYESVIEKYTK